MIWLAAAAKQQTTEHTEWAEYHGNDKTLVVSVLLRSVRAIRCLLLLLVVQTAEAQTRAGALAGPPAAFAAARAALSDTVRGAPLHVTLLTQGQGSALWERYGHNLLWIRNDATGASIIYNWGVFNFDEPGFVQRFLFATAEYKIEGVDATRMLNHLSRSGREIIAQDLALSAGQRAAVDAFVRANEMPGNEYYRYDYFLDNCSTRLRDVLDFALGGALRMALEPRVGTDTYRSETLRLNQHDDVLFAGLDLALGWPADRAMTTWEMAFVPMRLRDALRAINVAAANGARVPLVSNERVLIRGTAPPEPTTIESGRVRAAIVLIGLAVALLALFLGFRAGRGSRGMRVALTALAVIVHVALGAAGLLLVFMWFFTRHAFWAWNPHLLLLTPLSFAVAVSVLRTWRAERAKRWVVVYHFVMATSGFAVVAAVLGSHISGSTAAAEMLVAWANAAWLMQFALGVALGRLAGGGGVPPLEAAPGERLAA